ncbi:MAG: hypothetical protein OXC79_06655 [Candidatus Poribacteria bacterium]|nr:hypothetical protein [Candidatus Poribacteria bacterium]
MMRQKRMRIRDKKEMKQMTVTVYSYPNNNNLHLEVLDNAKETSTVNNSQLSVDERMALLNKLADKFMEFVGPDFPPLSDYAVSREGLYEDHL